LDLERGKRSPVFHCGWEKEREKWVFAFFHARSCCWNDGIEHCISRRTFFLITFGQILCRRCYLCVDQYICCGVVITWSSNICTNRTLHDSSRAASEFVLSRAGPEPGLMWVEGEEVTPTLSPVFIFAETPRRRWRVRKSSDSQERAGLGMGSRNALGCRGRSRESLDPSSFVER